MENIRCEACYARIMTCRVFPPDRGIQLGSFALQNVSIKQGYMSTWQDWKHYVTLRDAMLRYGMIRKMLLAVRQKRFDNDFESQMPIITPRGTLIGSPGRRTLAPSPLYHLQFSSPARGYRFTPKISAWIAQIKPTHPYVHKTIYTLKYRDKSPNVSHGVPDLNQPPRTLFLHGSP